MTLFSKRILFSTFNHWICCPLVVSYQYYIKNGTLYHKLTSTLQMKTGLNLKISHTSHYLLNQDYISTKSIDNLRLFNLLYTLNYYILNIATQKPLNYCNNKVAHELCLSLIDAHFYLSAVLVAFVSPVMTVAGLVISVKVLKLTVS